MQPPTVDQLKRLRGLTRRSQEWWARRLSVSLSAYRRWEYGGAMPAATWELMTIVAQKLMAEQDATEFREADFDAPRRYIPRSDLDEK